MKKFDFINKWPFHLGLIIFSIVSDQLTKLWALVRFTNETGAPNHDVINIIGELVRFQLVFNKGAAFSSRPQDLMPFLPPWLFFLLISIVAGVVMILGGAVGNFIDRMRLSMVVDFIDCDFPDFIMTRFPTFNVADSFVTVGVAIVILSPIILKKIHQEIKIEKENKNTVAREAAQQTDVESKEQ